MTTDNEATILRKILLSCSRGATRLFRIASSAAWVGKYEGRTRDGCVILSNASIVQPAPEGFPDLVGWKSVVVTPDMVGKTLAVFVGLEVKAAAGRVSEVQSSMLDAIERSGGIALVSRSPLTAAEALEQGVSRRDKAGSRASRPQDLTSLRRGANLHL